MDLKLAAEILLSSGFDVYEVDDRDTDCLSGGEILKLITGNTNYIVVTDNSDTDFEVRIKFTTLKCTDLLLSKVTSLICLRQKLEVAIAKLECLWDLSELKNSAIKLVEDFDVTSIKSLFSENDGLYSEDIDQIIADVKDNN